MTNGGIMAIIRQVLNFGSCVSWDGMHTISEMCLLVEFCFHRLSHDCVNMCCMVFHCAMIFFYLRVS